MERRSFIHEEHKMKYVLYCEECKEALCVDCMDNHNRGHHVFNIAKAIDRNDLNEEIKTCKNYIQFIDDQTKIFPKIMPAELRDRGKTKVIEACQSYNKKLNDLKLELINFFTKQNNIKFLRMVWKPWASRARCCR